MATLDFGNLYVVQEFKTSFELLVAHPHGQDSGGIAMGDGLKKDHLSNIRLVATWMKYNRYHREPLLLMI